MWDFLLLPIKQLTSSQSSSSPKSFSNSNSSSRRSSLSSSSQEFRPIHSEIIRRKLVTDFLEATSVPVNIPIHRSREASRPSTPMREEFDRCTKQLPFSLASKLFHCPPEPGLVGEEIVDEGESEGESWGSEEEENMMRRCRSRIKRRRKSKIAEYSDLMFLMEI